MKDNPVRLFQDDTPSLITSWTRQGSIMSTQLPTPSTTPYPADDKTEERPSPTPPSISKHQSAITSGPIETSKGIGPYSSAVGLTQDHFLSSISEGVFRSVSSIKNGLVLELYEYLTITLGYNAISVVHVLSKLNPQESFNEKGLNVAVKRLWQKRLKVVRNLKREVKDRALTELKEVGFKLIRKTVVNKVPDTPRKKKLKLELQSEKDAHRRSNRKLSAAEGSMAEMTEKIVQNEGIEEQLHKEKQAKKAVLADMANLQEEADGLKAKLKDITTQYDHAMSQLNEMNLNFNPVKDDPDDYKKRYEAQQKHVTALEEKYSKAKSKLGGVSTRNVNKRIKNREKKYLSEKEKNDGLVKQNEELDEMLNNLKEELKDSCAKLYQCEKETNILKERLAAKTIQKTKVHKMNWKLKQRHDMQDGQEMYTEHDMAAMRNRVDMLRQRNKELQEVISLMEDAEVTTFEEGKYTDEVRKTVMALLSMNVATSKISDVIRIVLKKLAKKMVERLPSVGLISEIRLEARHLADIEVGLAMRNNEPEAALGNCIHGDGTTKYHKKYQNFQVTLPDGTSRTLSLQQLAAGDTDAIVNAYRERMKELAVAVASVEEGSIDDITDHLLSTVKSAMTDQGPTMPQFGDKLQSIREELLPKVVNNWDSLPSNVQECMGNFGQFYCKMHPLINFAEESNKVLKSLEDISTSGKNVHTLLTAEAGVTRLIRTASKAFHHRGCDKSGVEEAFSSYLENQYNSKNHLVQYVGNRANILFEGAASAYFHLDHIVDFVSHLPDPNSLLQAVSEDAQEKIHRAELRALGIIHKSITAPLWHTTKCAKNVLSLNKPLHELQQNLIRWKLDASGLMMGEVALEGAPIVKDGIYDRLFEECTDSELYGMCQQALELLCCGLLIILERQCKDQLPGGRYWDPSNEVEAAYANVPTTNVIGERDFAWLDFLVREKPSARVITLETLIMWANNGTLQWLDNLDSETKATYMEQARAHAPEILRHYKQKMLDIKKQRWEHLQHKQRDKAAKEAKQVASRLKLTNEISAQGGVWHTPSLVNEKFAEYDLSKSDEEVKRALYTQLSFHQKILKSKTPKKEFFQLSMTKDGQSKKFSKFEMRDNLLQIVNANNFPKDYTAPKSSDSPPSPPRPVTYTEPVEQQKRYEEVKQKMFEKIYCERQRRAVKQSQLYIDRLAKDPQLLVNKRVQHKCKDPGGVDRWFHGMVISVKPFISDDLKDVISKTMFTIHYEENQLGEDEPSVETFPLLVDLQRNDFIIVGKI